MSEYDRQMEQIREQQAYERFVEQQQEEEYYRKLREQVEECALSNQITKIAAVEADRDILMAISESEAAKRAIRIAVKEFHERHVVK